MRGDLVSDTTVRMEIRGLDELMAKFARLDDLARGRLLRDAVEAAALVVLNAATSLVPRKTSNLMRSLHVEVEEADGQVTAEIGTDVVYAAIQEYGGTITPKTSKFLSIPLTEVAKAAISPRNYAGELRFVGHNNGGVLVDEAGAAQYALVTSVTIPAKPYLRPALDNNVEAVRSQLENIIAQLLGMEAS
jgi:phage gpG-like protein